MSKYWVLRNKKDNKGVYVDAIPNSGVANWKYSEGIPLKADFNNDVKIYYSQNFPDGKQLYDFVSNILRVLIVSDKVKQLLQNESIENIEYLPLVVCDHKKNVVDDKYWLINLIGGQDVIDMEKSKYVMGSLNETQIKRIKKLVVNEYGVDGNPKLFRANAKRNLFFIHETIKNIFEKNNITGYNVFEADGWDGFDF